MLSTRIELLETLYSSEIGLKIINLGNDELEALIYQLSSKIKGIELIEDFVDEDNLRIKMNAICSLSHLRNFTIKIPNLQAGGNLLYLEFICKILTKKSMQAIDFVISPLINAAEPDNVDHWVKFTKALQTSTISAITLNHNFMPNLNHSNEIDYISCILKAITLNTSISVFDWKYSTFSDRYYPHKLQTFYLEMMYILLTRINFTFSGDSSILNEIIKLIKKTYSSSIKTNLSSLQWVCDLSRFSNNVLDKEDKTTFIIDNLTYLMNKSPYLNHLDLFIPINAYYDQNEIDKFTESILNCNLLTLSIRSLPKSLLWQDFVKDLIFKFNGDYLKIQYNDNDFKIPRAFNFSSYIGNFMKKINYRKYLDENIFEIVLPHCENVKDVVIVIRQFIFNDCCDIVISSNTQMQKQGKKKHSLDVLNECKKIHGIENLKKYSKKHKHCLTILNNKIV